MFTIDPGVQGTGWASWVGKTPVAAGIVETAADEGWELRLYDVVTALMAAYRDLQRVSQNDHPAIVCEMMEFYGTGGGSAPWATGDLQRILVLSGWFCGRVHARAEDVVFVRPSEWKGQLPKRVVQQRITALLGEELCDHLEVKSHAWDAIGIGLWRLGKL